MIDKSIVPCVPDSAPFTPEQRAYLNGFLAGLFSRASARALETSAASAAASPLTPLTILFGSQTGNSERLAKRAAKEAGKRGFAPTIFDFANYPITQLASEERLLIVTSTYGDGEPPDSAGAFWNSLNGEAAPRLSRTRFSVCALGDSNYPKFCAYGKAVDARIESLDAQRVFPRVDCDVDFEEPFGKWLGGALDALGANSPSNVLPNSSAPATASDTGNQQNPASVYSRSHPFPGALVTNRRLNLPGSEKDTRHIEITIDASSLAYEVGDALGVYPTNCPELVADILSALNYSGDESVPGRDRAPIGLREALLNHYEITKIPRPFLEAIAERSDDAELKKLASPEANGELTKFLWGREVVDLLLACPSVKFSPAEFVALLRKLQPRLYSIASSPKAHLGRVHLTVGVVRYESHSRNRKGVCSTFLADRTESNPPVPVFIQPNKNFRLPADGNAPAIMIGPGTGVAPFRAFLQERRVVGATGKNWLFFGDQRSRTDSLYRDELSAMRDDGLLTRLDTAFSEISRKRSMCSIECVSMRKNCFPGWKTARTLMSVAMPIGWPKMWMRNCAVLFSPSADVWKRKRQTTSLGCKPGNDINEMCIRGKKKTPPMPCGTVPLNLLETDRNPPDCLRLPVKACRPQPVLWFLG